MGEAAGLLQGVKLSRYRSYAFVELTIVVGIAIRGGVYESLLTTIATGVYGELPLTFMDRKGAAQNACFKSDRFFIEWTNTVDLSATYLPARYTS